VLYTLGDADFKYANGQLYSAFRVLTDASDQFETASGSSSPTLSDKASEMNLAFKPVTETPEVSEAGGVVLPGGMPRGDLAVDMAAQLGGAEKSSQCEMSLVRDAAGDIDTSVEPGLHPGLGATEALQSELAPLWWTSRKGLFSSEFRQCSREKIVQIHSRKTLSGA